MQKIGLVLEGGAMRGMYTAGVMDVMLEHDISFDGIIGVSAGAAFGCNYKSKQIGRVLRYNTKFANDKRYAGIGSLIKTGDYFNAEFAYYTVPKELDVFDEDTYNSNKTKFYVVATDVDTGRAVYKDISKIDDESTEWIRASASMPIVSKPVCINGHKYLDGGLSDSIPVKWMEDNGYDKNIVILTRPIGYIKKPAIKPLTKLTTLNYPKIEEAILNRSKVYNDTLKYVESDDSILVIRPSADLNLSRTEKNPEKLKEMYELGRKDATNQINEILKYVASTNA